MIFIAQGVLSTQLATSGSGIVMTRMTSSSRTCTIKSVMKKATGQSRLGIEGFSVIYLINPSSCWTELKNIFTFEHTKICQN